MVELAIEQAEQIKKIRNRVETGLSMSRVPRDTKEAFIAIADAEYCSDYGMLLKALLDSYLRSNQLDAIANKLNELEIRLAQLEGKPASPKKIITTLSGKKIEKVEKKEEKKDE